MAAEALGIPSETGGIEVGKAADLIAVEGDPLANIEAVESPVLVTKEGRLVKEAGTA